jgi:N-acetylornithine carbamoyltransferase
MKTLKNSKMKDENVFSKIGKKRDFLSTQNWSKEDLDELLDITKDIKANPSKYWDSLKGKSLCLFFFNPSTRTRNSIEVGISQLGGYAVYNDPNFSWWGQKSESVKDTAKVLSRYHAAIAIRMFPNRIGWVPGKAHQQLIDFAKHSSAPVINLEDDTFHPLQEMADIFTIKEKLKKQEKKKIVISWAYHPKPLPLSVPNSISMISTRYGMDVELLCPPGFELRDKILETAKNNAETSGGSFNVSHDIEDSYRGADVVYVKSWGSPKHYGDPRSEKKMRIPYRDTWTCKSEYMDWANKNSIFMHCLPLRRNIVATDEVVDGPHSVIYDQAENRLYTVKAVMYELMRNPFLEKPTFY